MNKLIPFLSILAIHNIAIAKNEFFDKGVSNLVINEFLADPATNITGDANGDGVRDSADDEFVEIYNHSDNAQDISGWTLNDGTQVRHTFPASTVVPGRCSIVVFGGGTPTGAFGFSEVQTASEGSLSHNNSGDTISLKSGNTTIATHTYGSTEGNANQSYTRDPVGSGVFVAHDTAMDANGALFSPGANPDGSYFTGCPVGDLPPTITSTTPDDKAGGVATNATITVNFSENVDAIAGAFTLSCESGAITLSGLPALDTDTMVLTPDSSLPDGEICTVTAVAANITDKGDDSYELDGNGDTAPGDNYIWTFIVGNPSFEIWEIQGSGTASPLEGYTLDSNDNIITALDTNGFYIQTPDIRSDGDTDTSDGLFVYLGLDPAGTYAVGDQVDVNGPIVEFFGTTEFTTPVVVNIDSSDNSLPTPVTLNDSFPPNDPTVPVCSTDQETHKWECLEGMPFDMPQGFISSGFAGNPVFPGANGEDVYVRAGSARAFREPGIDHPGDAGLSTLVYDGNPEILELDFDGLTIDLGTIDYTQYAGGTEISMKGIFGYEFDEYEIWPSEINIINANSLPGAVRNATSTEYTIGSANLFRLFDEVDDPWPTDDESVPFDDYMDKLDKLSKYIVNDLKSPMILAVQEAENIGTLNTLASRVASESSGTVNYTAHLIEGGDVGGIDVGFLLRDNVTPSDGFPVQLGASEQYLNPNGNFMATLHDRPPLHLEADVTLADGTVRVQVLAIHNRSRGSIEDSNPLEAARVRTKRFEQANSIANMIDTIQSANPGDPVITLGDFNAFQFSDGYADILGQITGTAVDEENEYWSLPLFASAPLTQAVLTLPTNQQYSYIFNGSAQLLDNAILNDDALTAMNEIQFARGQSDANISYADNRFTSLRVSDHDGFVLFMTEDFDLIYKNGFDN